MPRTFDAIDRSYMTREWRAVARAVLERDGYLCAACRKLGADMVHHRREKRDGGSDDPSNLEAMHKGCHNRLHKARRP